VVSVDKSRAALVRMRFQDLHVVHHHKGDSHCRRRWDRVRFHWRIRSRLLSVVAERDRTPITTADWAVVDERMAMVAAPIVNFSVVAGGD